jgi:hypothetical protein
MRRACLAFSRKDSMSIAHENVKRETVNRGPSDRSFGWLFAVIFLCLALWPLRHGDRIRPLFLALGGIILLITLVRPALLHGPNLMWGKLSLILARVTTPIITGILFYLAFTPIATIIRCMGKDLLALSLDPNAKTYWIPRNRSTNESSMNDQF